MYPFVGLPPDVCFILLRLLDNESLKSLRLVSSNFNWVNAKLFEHLTIQHLKKIPLKLTKLLQSSDLRVSLKLLKFNTDCSSDEFCAGDLDGIATLRRIAQAIFKYEDVRIHTIYIDGSIHCLDEILWTFATSGIVSIRHIVVSRASHAETGILSSWRLGDPDQRISSMFLNLDMLKMPICLLEHESYRLLLSQAAKNISHLHLHNRWSTTRREPGSENIGRWQMRQRALRMSRPLSLDNLSESLMQSTRLQTISISNLNIDSGALGLLARYTENIKELSLFRVCLVFSNALPTEGAQILDDDGKVLPNDRQWCFTRWQDFIDMFQAVYKNTPKRLYVGSLTEHSGIARLETDGDINIVRVLTEVEIITRL
jgi:hypothetical protein